MRRRAARVRLRNPSMRRPEQLPEPTEQARQHAHDIPQQRVVGRIMDVGLHHRRVDRSFVPSSSPRSTAAFTTDH